MFHKFPSSLRKITSAFTMLLFIFSSVTPPVALAQGAPAFLNLPAPGTMLTATAAYNPPVIMGVNLRPEDSLMFDFIIDKGDSGLEGEEFNDEANKLIKYFLAALTTPQEQMWVNLSPYESGRIIPEVFGRTEMGRDMLAQDYILKQLSASLLSPEEALGEKFWNRFQTQAQAKFGTSDIPLSVFNKIWIVPEVASIFEHAKGAYIVESKLKVMLEQDYLALDVNRNSTEHGLGAMTDSDLNQITGTAAEIIREVLLPEIEREVNEGRLFAPLRQIFHSMLLAKWYKDNLKESLLGQVYADQSKTVGVDSDPSANQHIYDAYLKAFETGAYNYMKEEYDPITQSVIPKKYFSGGIRADQAMVNEIKEFDFRNYNPDIAIFTTAFAQENGNIDPSLDRLRQNVFKDYLRLDKGVNLKDTNIRDITPVLREIEEFNRTFEELSNLRPSGETARNVGAALLGLTALMAPSSAEGQQTSPAFTENPNDFAVVQIVQPIGTGEKGTMADVIVDTAAANSFSAFYYRTAITKPVTTSDGVVNVTYSVSQDDDTYAVEVRDGDTGGYNIWTGRVSVSDFDSFTSDIGGSTSANLALTLSSQGFEQTGVGHILSNEGEKIEIERNKINLFRVDPRNPEVVSSVGIQLPDEVIPYFRSQVEALRGSEDPFRAAEELNKAASDATPDQAMLTQTTNMQRLIQRMTRFDNGVAEMEVLEATLLERYAKSGKTIAEAWRSYRDDLQSESGVLNYIRRQSPDTIENFRQRFVRLYPQFQQAQRADADSAMATPRDRVGGIDFNPAIVAMNVFNDGEGFEVIPPTLEQIEQFMNTNGFVPVIINVQPVVNLPMLLGMAEDEAPPTPSATGVISRL